MTEIESKLDRIISCQAAQNENSRTILGEVENLRKSFERLHARFDEIHEKTIIHGQKIDNICNKIAASENVCHEQRELIWQKIRDTKKEAITTAKKDVKLWIYPTAFGGLAGIISLLYGLITTIFKSKIG